MLVAHPTEQEMLRMNAKRAVRTYLAGVVCLLLIACGTPDVAPTEGVANASPGVATPVEPTPAPPTEVGTPDESFPDGFVLTMNASYDPTFRPELLVQGYDIFVIGRVAEELPARWTTPDGSRPSDLLVDVPERYTIITPYVLELGVPDYLREMTEPLVPLDDRAAAAFPADTTRIVVVTEGGTVGKDSVVHVPSELLTVGERVLIGLVESRDNRADVAFDHLVPTAVGPVWWGVERFVLGNDGSATFYDQSLPATEVVSGLLDARARMNAATPVP